MFDLLKSDGVDRLYQALNLFKTQAFIGLYIQLVYSFVTVPRLCHKVCFSIDFLLETH